MKWIKKGFVFKPSEHNLSWHKSHAMTPTPLLYDDKIRVFYAGRSSVGQSQISYFDLDREDPTKLLYVHPQPLFAVGPRGCFDDSGTICTSAVRIENTVYIYYTAYSLSVTVPYRNSIGVAISEDGGSTFRRMFEGPIVDRSKFEPYFVISPWVLKSGKDWHMWYASATNWILVDDKAESLYHIKYAKSTNGIEWIRENKSCILPKQPEEANARPSVIVDEGKFKMWFTYRGSRDFRDGLDSYRIGYAEAPLNSPDEWQRIDEKSGIIPGPDEFDNLMQAYPAILKVDNELMMFYNGNGFGAEGVLLAVNI
ncbi:hypothetical protein [Peijinzhouia sedimentorum]